MYFGGLQYLKCSVTSWLACSPENIIISSSHVALVACWARLISTIKQQHKMARMDIILSKQDSLRSREIRTGSSMVFRRQTRCNLHKKNVISDTDQYAAHQASCGPFSTSLANLTTPHTSSWDGTSNIVMRAATPNTPGEDKVFSTPWANSDGYVACVILASSRLLGVPTTPVADGPNI